MSERREHEEIEAENERRRQELEKRKRDDSITKATEINEMVEFILIKTPFGEDKTINKKNQINVNQHRKPLHRFCTEWMAFGDDQTEILVSEWNFTYNLGRKQSRKPEVDFRQFLSDLESFVITANLKLKNLSDFDQFLYPYSFIHLIKSSTESNNFKCSLLIGQEIDGEDMCVAENSDYLRKTSVCFPFNSRILI